MAKGRKEKFNDWLEPIFSDLESEYINCNLWLDLKQLQAKHWDKLWRIFEEHIEVENVNMDYELASYQGSRILLEAHGENHKELGECNRAFYYLNSKSYP